MIGNNLLSVINKVGFHTIDNFKIQLFSFFLVSLLQITNKMECIGECLDNAMVCNSNSLMSPSDSLLNYVFYRRNSIHITHLCMAVKFNSFVKSKVISWSSGIRRFSYSCYMGDRNLLIIFIKCCSTFYS